MEQKQETLSSRDEENAMEQQAVLGEKKSVKKNPPQLSTGCSSFETLRRNEWYYVDKTGVIAELLRDSATVAVFTRPRCFGKTLTISTLEDFLSIEKKDEAPSLFAGLNIIKDKEICEQWMNKYPVIYLSLKDVEGRTFDYAYSFLQYEIGTLFCSFTKKFLSPSASAIFDDEDLRKFLLLQKGSRGEAKPNIVMESLHILCRMVHSFYGKKPILLIDEYDVPLVKADKYGYYSDMIDIIYNLFNNVLKDTSNLERAILIGCFRISRETLFPELNNLNIYDISNTKFPDLFGFTLSEVKQMLEDTGFSSMENTIREWYDGYRFGKGYWQEIFCPLDVIRYIKELQEDDSIDLVTNPPFYWKNSNSTASDILPRIEEECGHLDATRVEDLLAGKCIAVELSEQITDKNIYTFTQSWKVDEIKNRQNILWTVLYMAGYLTLASSEKIQECGITPKPRETLLVITNRQIRKLFEDIVKAVKRSAKANTIQRFFHALWEGNDEDAQAFLSEFLLYDVSIPKKEIEDYYQALLQGLFIGAGYKVRPTLQYDAEYCGSAIFKGDKGIIIETRWASSGGKEDLQQLLEEAANQTKNRKYGLNTTKSIQFWYSIVGIGNHCLVKKVENIYASTHKKDFIER